MQLVISLMGLKFIAEIGQAHDGSLGIAHSYIDAIAETGVDIIKWQTHIAKAESSIYEPFRINFSYEDKSRFDYWKRMEFTYSQWKEIKNHCEDVGLEFMSSPFSVEAVNLLEDLNVKSYKIGSGEVTNLLMLEKIASTNKPIYLSSGLSSFAELDESIKLISKYKNDLTILQCTSDYPTVPESWGLNVIKDLKQRYKANTGFSDHSGDIFACLAAVSNGAKVLEFHAVFDKMIFGPDSTSSLTMKQIKKMIKGSKQIYQALNNPIDKNDNSEKSSMKLIFEKSLAVNKKILSGSVIKFEDLEAKKPSGKGISSKNYNDIIGRTLNKDLEKWQFITEDDLE